MTGIRVFVTGIGIISPIGRGLAETANALKTKKTGIKPLSLFHVSDNIASPVGEIALSETYSTPRTHKLALIAAQEAVKGQNPPDAIIIGTTTGGIDLTENLIKVKNFDPELYKYHSSGSLSEYLAEELNCKGIAMTVSTACSSGTLALKLAVEMLRCGIAKSVLAGGADALSRLTYHGFNSLQLLDPAGAKPLDVSRKGLSIAEGAAMLLLTAGTVTPANALAEIPGAGVTCDAYHPASPHPEGKGAAEAIKAAIKDAGISPDDINYINLHGTGTIDNDLSEAKAIRSVFGNIPALSSTKGAYGHPLATAGAIEAAISVISINENIIPENTGCETPDPALGIIPAKLTEANVDLVLSNSFGFGGNNASVIISKTDKYSHSATEYVRKPMTVLGYSCVTGAGNLEDTILALQRAGKCSGQVDTEKVSGLLDKKKLRRLKRLPKMVLSLAMQAQKDSGNVNPGSVFFGTGFGALSETYDFLEKLFESNEQFASPTDFIGSVHNAPAGQAAIWLNAAGPNVTATGGDYSFEQALLSASLMTKDDKTVIVIGTDEYHETLTKALDKSALTDTDHSDGGGAVILKQSDGSGLSLHLSFMEFVKNNDNIIRNLINNLEGVERINDLFGAIFVGIPSDKRTVAENQLQGILKEISSDIPVIDYRKFTGEYASASATASVIAINCVKTGFAYNPENGSRIDLKNKGILVIGFGDYITAIEIKK